MKETKEKKISYAAQENCKRLDEYFEKE